jgi:hypothetical protein
MNSRQKSSNFARNRSERQLCRKASRPSLSVTGYKEKAFGQIASRVDKVSVCPGDFSWVLKSSYAVERGAATRPLTVTGTGTAAPERGHFSIYFPIQNGETMRIVAPAALLAEDRKHGDLPATQRCAGRSRREANARAQRRSRCELD